MIVVEVRSNSLNSERISWERETGMSSDSTRSPIVFSWAGARYEYKRQTATDSAFASLIF